MSEEKSEIVEIEAIGLEEWDRDRHTPRAMDENLAALVKQSASSASGPVAAPKLDEGWDEAEAAKPRTTTNTLRRTGAAPAIPEDPRRKTQAFGVAVQRPPTAATSAVPKAVPAVQTKPIAREATAAQKPLEKPVASKPAVAPTKAAAPQAATKPAATKTSPALTPVAAPTAPKATKTSPALTPVAKPPTTPVTKASTEMAALKPAAPTTKAPAAVKPAAAPAKPPTATKPSAEMVAVKPAVKDMPPPKPAAPATPAAKSSSEMATLEPATPVAKSSSEMATLKAQAKHSMELPAWPPRPEPAYEDWEDQNAATSAGSRSPTSPPSGDWDGPRESSVIIDLNAVAARSESPRRAQTSPITQLTSEHGTTTSGAFEMPVAPVGKGSRPEAAIAPGGSFETLTAPMAPSAASFETVTAVNAPSAASFETLTVPNAPAIARAPTPFSLPLAAPPPEPAPMARAASPDLERASSPELGSRASAWQTPLPQTLPQAPVAPAPAPLFPSAAGLDYRGNDAVISAHGARHEPTEPRLARSSLLATVLPTPKSRRFAMIGVAAALVLVVVGFAMSGGAKSAPVAAKASTGMSAHDQAPSPAPAATTSQPAAAAHTRVATATDPTTASSEDTTVRATTPTTRPTPGKKQPAKRRLSRGKKPVVVDYDKQRDLTADQDQALAQARAAYATGNQHLFAGEASAAVSSYRQALAAYPGYVAGYRGLGLAYAQAGDRKAAVDAFKTYVKLAPAAKDVALIEKRIRNLSVAP